MPTITNRTGDGEVNTITFEEVIRATHSPQYTLAPGASRVRRVVDVPWASRVTAVKAFLGYPKVVAYAPGGGTDKYISRALPDYMPDFLNPTTGPYLWCMQVENLEGINPLGTFDNDGVAEYEYARLHLIYEATTYGVLVDEHPKIKSATTGKPDESKLRRYVTIAFKPSAEFIVLPRGFYKWVDGGSGGEVVHNMDFAGSRLIPSIEIHFIWRQVPVIPVAATTHVGCVNNAAFTISANNIEDEITYDAGTLLLLGVDLNRYKLGTGHSVFDITYRAKYMKNTNRTGGVPLPVGSSLGHNYFLRYFQSVKKLDYRLLTDDGLSTGEKVFAEKNFSLLFQPY